ncbi:SapC family protein [Stutzerimonas kirkiae]|uniref:SapC family protein n=1 Tax=Stutzerimonas kirkiae TaxID=2211392 RepID=A0A4Q9RDZ9_9GAMM|nr:SapC family protein [Stutzerimonas kirkiae]TBU99954.1 SapC family protein [Stutzerimonas kirkiae]TBV05660.1 SapC family protein [Stutzerimonas kirkiae]TBV10599.1 SapC family protein [Stutzerimonas kirkiae]TBV17454.1 SapC family protein [Stutzerimonas kirkiae]
MTQAQPVFYKQPRPLRAEQDATLGLLEGVDYSFAGISNSVPLAAAEFTQACKHYPILFADGAKPQPVALLGLRGGENLFVAEDGAWRSSYVPAYVRRYPFIFMENADKSEYALCIDEAAEGVVRDEGRPLFADGKPTPLLENALAFCRDYQGHHAFTEQFVDALQQAGLLTDNRADVSLASGEKLSLGGFKIIDEARFQQLPEETFLHWRERGWLHLVYCHFISMSNWATLIDLTAAQARD